MTTRTPAQKLARLIQAGTSQQYTVCLAEATAILDPVTRVWPEDDGRVTECGDRLQDWVCSLPPGPHPAWRHLDENEGYWWSQSRLFPYSNAVDIRKPIPDTAGDV